MSRNNSWASYNLNKLHAIVVSFSHTEKDFIFARGRARVM